MTDTPIPPELPPVPSEERSYDRGERNQAPRQPSGATLSPSTGPSSGKSTGQPANSRVLYGRLAVGLGVIALGVINFFPRILNEFVRGEIWRLWPLILVGFGIFQFVKASTAKERHGAAWLIGAGLVLLVHFLNLFGLTWGTGWPLWILAAGLIDLSFPDKPRDRPIGLFLIALGSFLLLGRLDSLPDQWYRAWPLLVIFFGLVLVWQALFTRPDSGQLGWGESGKDRKEGHQHG